MGSLLKKYGIILQVRARALERVVTTKGSKMVSNKVRKRKDNGNEDINTNKIISPVACLIQIFPSMLLTELLVILWELR